MLVPSTPNVFISSRSVNEECWVTAVGAAGTGPADLSGMPACPLLLGFCTPIHDDAVCVGILLAAGARACLRGSSDGTLEAAGLLIDLCWPIAEAAMAGLVFDE